MGLRDRISPSLRRTVAATGCVAAASLGLAGLGPRAQAARPVVDRSFGNGGHVIARIGHREGEGLSIFTRRVPGDRLQVVLGDRVRQYRADGRLDPAFANDGRLNLAGQFGRLAFNPSILLPRLSGGLAVGGTTSQESGETDSQAWTTVRRYLPNGELDPGFATDGTFISQFGFPATVPAPEQTAVTPFGPAYYGGPHVDLLGLHSDSEGHLLIEGNALIEASSCPSGLFYGSHEEFVARLTGNGQADHSFGPEGIGSRKLVRVPCEPLRQGNELREPSRDFVGTPRHARMIATASGTDAKGRTVLLVDLAKEGAPWYLVRLTPSGRFDRTFGDHGKLAFRIPEDKRFAFISDIRVAPDGSTLLIGTIGRRQTPGSTESLPDRLYLGKVNDKGEFARSFGPGGFLSVGVGHLRIGEPISHVELSRGEVVVCASLGEFAAEGFVLTKLHPGR
jgi:hypothetical protein